MADKSKKRKPKPKPKPKAKQSAKAKSKKKSVRSKTKSSAAAKKKKARKKPKGPSWGPKPVDPTSGKPKKKWPRKKKKWPPKKPPRGSKKKPLPKPSLLQATDFSPHLDTVFTIVAPSPETDLVLVDVTSFGTQTLPDAVDDDIRTEPFSLTFHGPPSVAIPQNVYTLEHDDMGTLLMLLVPIGQHGSQTILEAIYN